MSKRDYYEVLEIEKGADEKEIRRAYRRMAMRYHPDRNPDDKEAEEKFKEAKEAYEVLSDAQKRAAYDQFGHAGLGGGQGGGGFGGAGAGGFSDIFGDMFGDIFGGGGARRGGPSRGADLRYAMEISLEQAVRGTTETIRVPSWDDCDACQGSGSKDGSQPVTCSTCGGMGQVRMQQGFFSVQQTCPACHGAGQEIKNPCNNCHGEGRTQTTREENIRIPAGVDNGDRVRVTGRGEPGSKGGPPGDLYIEIRVQKHAIFERDGNDLYCEVPLDFVDAALGGELEVPTLDGKVKLKIPAETQTGRLFRLRNKGVTGVRGGTGDLLCRVTLETPVSLTKEQKELLRKFQTSVQKGGKRHNPKKSGFLDAIKRLFEND